MTSLKRAIDLTSLPETKRTKWTPQEDDALSDAYQTFGTNWKKAEDVYGDAGNRRLSRHRRSSWRERVKRLQAEQLQAHGKIIDNRLTKLLVAPAVPVPVSTDRNLLQFTCKCGALHTWKTLLINGIQCKCSRTVQEMLAQLEGAFDWIVYIILAKPSKGLTDPVDYVGFSKDVKSRIAAHNHDFIRAANFDTIRISVVLGESTMITLLSPERNVQSTGNRQLSRVCHIWNPVQGTWTVQEKCTFKYDTPIYDRIAALQNSTIACCEDYNTTAGTLFTGTIRHSSDDDVFCFLKNPKGDLVNGVARCACTPLLCSYRKILNALRGRPITDGIEESQLKDVIRPYRPLPVVSRDPHPSWTFSFIQTVIQRNKLAPATLRNYDKHLQELWDNGALQHLFAQPWMVLREIEKHPNRSSQQSICSALMCLVSHLTNIEYQMLFPAFSALRVEYQRLSIHISSKTAAERQRQLNRQIQNWAETQEIEKAILLMESSCASVHDFQKIVWLRLQLYHENIPTNLNNVKISQYDIDTDNYFDPITCRLIINNEPIRNIRGRKTIVLEDRVASDVVKLYHKRIGITDYLFAKDGHLPFSNTELTVAVKSSLYRYLNKHIGVQMLRKICRTTT